MDTELTYLAWAIVLALVQIVVPAFFFTAANGFAYAAGSRDTPPPARVSVVGGRLERASKNLLETLPLATAAILMAHVAGRHNALTEYGAALYVWARLVFVAVYAAGIPAVRSAVWLASVAGIVLVLLGLHWG